MNISIIQVGKTKEQYFQAAEQEYVKRLRSDAKIKQITVKSARGEIPKMKEEEGNNIMKVIPKNTFIIALHEKGKQMTSPEFASFLKKKGEMGVSHITFIIGGTHGFAPSILEKADMILSFSTFTFTHEMIRTILLEQLYRAFSIIKGKAYHY